MHPLLGWDHLLAMIAVGLWASLMRGAARWRLPLTFLLLMAAGGALGAAGVYLPAVEAGIAVSVILLGVVVAAALVPSPAIAAVAVGCFAILHGHAHGTESPAGTAALAYAAGFIPASAILHLAGIGIGDLLHRPFGRIAMRVSGGVMALAGTVLLLPLA
jgi:urease accessory protein